MSVYQQIITIVTDPPGNLAFHLVLAATTAGVLFSAYSVWRRKKFPQGNRMILGLAILLGLQLVFLLSSWINYPQPSSQPIGEQAGTLVSILVIIWLWVFPEPDRTADLGSTAAGSLVLFCALIDYFLFTGAASSPIPGLTWSELFWTFLPLLILSLGGTALLIRLPNGWLYGAGMIGLLGLGHVLALMLPPTNGTFPGAVRLVQLAAYPLLFSLPERFSSYSKAPAEQEETAVQERERRRSGLSLSLLETILDFSSSSHQKENHQHIAKLVSQVLIADICLLIDSPDDKGSIEILAGFDLIREEYFKSSTIDSKSIPLLSTYIRQGKLLHLPASSTSRDLINLTQILQLGQSGHLLACPLQPQGRDKPLGIVVMSPYSQRYWSPEDQNFLTRTTALISGTIDKAAGAPHQQVQTLKGKLSRVTTELEEARKENDDLSQKLTDSNAIIEEAQKTIPALQDLKSEYLQLREAHQLLKDREAHLSQLAFGETGEEKQQNLRLALMELSNLKEELRLAEKEIKKLQEEQTGSDHYSLTQIEALTTFAYRLRYPLHSMMEYTAETFDKSSNLMNSLQQQLFERLQSASEEIDHVLDEVLEGPGKEFGQADRQPGDLNKAVEISLRNVKYRMRSKDVTAEVDIPLENPPLSTEHYALLDILMVLVSNAVKRTRQGGTILIRATRYEESQENHFAYLQVADQSEGIPAQQISLIFQDLTEESPLPGSDVPDELMFLSALKKQVEDQGGRIWVDSDPGIGTTVSLLLPFLSPPA